MSDNYQAIYDATRSRLAGATDAIRDAATQAFDISHQVYQLQQEFANAAYMMQRPSVLYRPTVAPDGDKWCALYGPNLMGGVCGFGDTPEEAMRDFDKNWNTECTPDAVRRAKEDNGQFGVGA